MRIPQLSKILMTVHGTLVLTLFFSVRANAGGYQNGLQWAIIACLDFPVFWPMQYIPERIFNPALISESKLNYITLGYALTTGSVYWCALGWLGAWAYGKGRKKKETERAE